MKCTSSWFFIKYTFRPFWGTATLEEWKYLKDLILATRKLVHKQLDISQINYLLICNIWTLGELSKVKSDSEAQEDNDDEKWLILSSLRLRSNS